MGKLRWKIAQAFELNWWQRYLKGKNMPEHILWKENYWKNLLRKIRTGLQLKKDDAVLDVGCGPTGIFMVLNDYRVTAVDSLINSYQSKLPHFNKSDYPYVEFHNISFEHFETGRKYKTVFCINAINHAADIKAFVEKLIQATADSGSIILSVDAHNYTFFKHVFRLLPGDILHPFQYGINEYKSMFDKRSCRIKESILLKKQFLYNYYLLVIEKEV